MKKILCAIMVFFASIYVLPIITVGKAQVYDISNTKMPDTSYKYEPGTKEENDNQYKGYDDTHTVKVSVNGQTQSMTVREYLICVLAAEMPASFPIEALKAQAVAARSYMIYKTENFSVPSEHPNAQLCDDHNHCTAFFDVLEKSGELWGDNAKYYYERIAAAVDETDGIVAVYKNKVIAAVFHSASAERTESAKDVWGENFDYLTSVTTSGGSASPSYYGTLVISQSDFADKIKKKYPNAKLSGKASTWFSKINRNKSGTISDITVGGIKISGTEIRSILELKSTNFSVEISGTDLVFTTVGTGHGVGLSQYGAREMALNGACFDEILCHYYNGIQLMIKK